MTQKFTKNELSFLIALITLIILLITGNGSTFKSSFFVEILLFFIVFGVIMFAAMGVVHHAEMLAEKLGEPYGTMVLTLSAVTMKIINFS